MKKPVALVILDGWGNNPNHDFNAVYSANTPNFDRLISEFPTTEIGASGMDVGLPEGQMGNSEVGHLNIGAGRVIYQELTRITKSIKDGDFFTNPELLKAVNNAKENNKALHLFGLLSDGGVHSHIEHLKGFIDLCKQNGLEKVYVHAFLDGRDTPPQSALGYIADIENHMAAVGTGKIATVSGRYYSMDRDKRWERVELAYRTLVYGEGKGFASASELVAANYAEGVNDEFVMPGVILENGQPMAKVSEGDSVIFFNFRPDRAREITRTIVDESFDGFERQYFKTTYVCLTQYDLTMPNVSVAYAPQTINNTLGTYIASKGLNQLRIAETEKYAHVTFFFNGGVEAPNENEDRALVPSPKVATYDLQPEMSAYELTDALLGKLDEDKYDLIICNYANPDMVGHTGVFEAAVEAVETVDTCLGKVIDKMLSIGGKVIVTADHGNAEMMVDYETGTVFTAHTINRVPVIVVGSDATSLRSGGKLCDLAPTLLDLMNLDKPVEMTGTSLLQK